jgi:hypothetical protein
VFNAELSQFLAEKQKRVYSLLGRMWLVKKLTTNQMIGLQIIEGRVWSAKK